MIDDFDQVTADLFEQLNGIDRSECHACVLSDLIIEALQCKIASLEEQIADLRAEL